MDDHNPRNGKSGHVTCITGAIEEVSFPPDQKPGGLWLEGTYLIHPNSISKTCQKGRDNHSLFGDATATNFECLWFYFIMGEIFSLGCMFFFMFFGLVPWKWWEKSDDESAIDVVSKCGIPKGLSIGEKHIGGVLSPHISETDHHKHVQIHWGNYSQKLEIWSSNSSYRCDSPNEATYLLGLIQVGFFENRYRNFS